MRAHIDPKCGSVSRSFWKDTVDSRDTIAPGKWAGVREVVSMAGPIMLGSVSFAFMEFINKIFVGQLGTEHLAAIGAASIWSYTLGVFFLGIAACVSTFASQCLGRGDVESCSRYAWQGVYVSIASGTCAMLMWPLSRTLFELMNHGPVVTELELTYFRIRLISCGFVAWQASLAGFFQATRRPVIPMAAAIVGDLLNVLLDYLLIFGHYGFPRLGIAGAAIATVTSLLIQTAIMQAVFLSAPIDRGYGSRKTYRLDISKFRELFRIGWPSGVSNLLDIMGWALFTSFLIGHFGQVALAGHNGAITFMHLSFIPALGLSQAATAIVGRWIGKGEIAIAKSRAYTATVVGVVVMGTVGIFMGVNGRHLIPLLSKDPAVIDVGATLLILAATFAAFDAINIVLIGALRGAGDTRWIMYVLTIGAYCFYIPLGWFFAVPLELGAVGAWLGATIYVIGLSALVFARFRSEAWRSINIFGPGETPEQPVEAAMGTLPHQLELERSELAP